MPIYAYRCRECGFEKDYLQKVRDPVLTDCPNCGKPALAKQITAAGFQLKGSGWYSTDFRNSSKPAAKESAKDAAKDSGGSSPPTTNPPKAPAGNCPGGPLSPPLTLNSPPPSPPASRRMAHSPEPLAKTPQ